MGKILKFTTTIEEVKFQRLLSNMKKELEKQFDGQVNTNKNNVLPLKDKLQKDRHNAYNVWFDQFLKDYHNDNDLFIYDLGKGSKYWDKKEEDDE